LSTKKVGALLAYLALHPDQVQARPKLAALLWGDHSEVPARDSLRQALSLLRKALSRIDPHALVAHEDTITFVPTALTTDAIAFADLVAQQGPENLERAIALYGGELLEGFQVRAPEFESWVTAERERLRELALQAMTRLLDHHLSTGAVEPGIRIAARLLAADPMQEQVHRSLMELYCRQGRHGAALRQYRTCADVLAQELGIEPDATTKALRREILRKWNQQPGTTAGGNAAFKSLPDVEIELPATPRPPERRQVTVLVCDLVGMSALAARLDPEELQALVAGYRRCCMPIISQSGGTVGKVSGAEMLTYFGYPQAHEHDAERALHAGLGLVEAVSKLDGSAGALQLRVGIATGPVVIGDLLGDGVDRHGIIGEAAQIADWLQTLAEPNTVVIAESTRRLIGQLFDCSELGPLARNGFAQASAWRVLGPSGVDSRFEALRAATTPLIGRDEELELLQRRWRQTANGVGRVVLLSGEAGIGKSRLAAELQDRLATDSHTRVRYFCSPHHQNTALYPIISQLQRAAGFRRDDDEEQRLDKLEAVLARATSDLGDAVPLIADLLSLSTADRQPPLELTPQKRKEKTLRALLAQLEGLASREPVLMVFEDVHWIDPTSLELVDLIVDRIAELPVLLIISFRSEFAPPWVGRAHVTLLTINRLPPSRRAEMIAALTGGIALPREIADQIIDRTDGVPLFIEELTKAVLEGGLVGPSGDRQAAAGLRSQPTIPWTLHASLLARLDRLASVKEIAQIGAAVGREFSYGLIAEVAALPDRDLEAALAQLVNAELVFQRGVPPDATYLFKHALVQDVAYASLSRERRRESHGRIARAIEARAPDVAISEPEVLAHHFTEADCAREAIGYWLKAGQVALARSANREAVSHLEKGLATVCRLPEGADRDRHELQLQYALGNALNAAQGYGADATLAAFERARELIARTGDDSNIDFVIEGLTTTLFNRAAYRDCLKIRREFLAIAEQRGDPGSLCVAHRGIAGIHNVFGNFVDAHAHSEKAWSYHVSTKHRPAAGRSVRDIGVSVLCHLAIAEWHLGFLDRSRSHLAESIALARASNHPNTVGYAHVWAAALSFMARDYDALRQYASIIRRLGQEQSVPYYASWGTCLDAAALAAAGDDQGALDMAMTGQALRKQFQARALSPVFLCALAEVHRHGRRNEAALSAIADALKIADETDERWIDAELWRLKAELISTTGGTCAASTSESLYRRAVQIAQGQSARVFALRAATSLARLWRDQGKRKEARELLVPVYRGFTEGFDAPDLKEARAVLEQIAEVPPDRAAHA
jgi:DNA-binding SARP family transcriptional activator/class 3 adenylate cyclase